MSDILFENNFFRNWHRPQYWARTKKKELSKLYPVTVHKLHTGGVTITFAEPFGEQITFELDKKAKDILRSQLM
ncbi:MAG TPA: hypothetical protein VGK47_05385 [Nitrososphaeraceae archaeon]